MAAQKTLVEPKNFNLQPHLTNIISSTFSFLKAAFLWHKLKPLLWNWALLCAALEWGEVYLKGRGLWCQVHCVCVCVCLISSLPLDSSRSFVKAEYSAHFSRLLRQVNYVASVKHFYTQGVPINECSVWGITSHLATSGRDNRQLCCTLFKNPNECSCLDQGLYSVTQWSFTTFRGSVCPELSISLQGGCLDTESGVGVAGHSELVAAQAHPLGLPYLSGKNR